MKTEEELQRLKSAARIGAAGHLAAIRAVRPGVGEWGVEAVLEAAFRRHGAAGPAFPSIVAAGANATTLHYTANSSRIESYDFRNPIFLTEVELHRRPRVPDRSGRRHPLVAVEDPGYPDARSIFKLAGAETLPTPVDGEGIVTSSISSAASPFPP